MNDKNCALAQENPITVNKINNGNPFGSTPNSNPSLYINNDLSNGGGSINTEMDGLTKILTCASDVIPNETNHIKLAIADGESFTVELMASGVDNLGGFEFMLAYDPSLIEFTDASLNHSFLGNTGRTFSQIDPNNNLAAGTLTYAAFSLGSNPGPNGDGVLATLTFSMLAEGTSHIEVSRAQVANITGGAQEIAQMSGALVNAPPTAVQLAQIGSTEERTTRPWLLGLMVGGLVVLLVRRVRKGQLG